MDYIRTHILCILYINCIHIFFSVSIQTSALAKGALQLVRNSYIKDIEKNPGQNKPVYASVNTTVGFANSCLGPMSQKLH